MERVSDHLPGKWENDTELAKSINIQYIWNLIYCYIFSYSANLVGDTVFVFIFVGFF